MSIWHRACHNNPTYVPREEPRLREHRVVPVQPTLDLGSIRLRDFRVRLLPVVPAVRVGRPSQLMSVSPSRTQLKDIAYAYVQLELALPREVPDGPLEVAHLDARRLLEPRRPLHVALRWYQRPEPPILEGEVAADRAGLEDLEAGVVGVDDVGDLAKGVVGAVGGGLVLELVEADLGELVRDCELCEDEQYALGRGRDRVAVHCDDHGGCVWVRVVGKWREPSHGVSAERSVVRGWPR